MRHRLTLSATLALLSAFLGLPARAQVQPQISRTIVASHDFDAVAETFCVLGNTVTGAGTVSSSSTTVTANTTTAFAAVAAGAEITFDRGPALAPRFVTGYVNTVTDGDTLVVNDAPSVAAGSSWSYRNLACGTASGAGAFSVADTTPRRTWQLQVDQLTIDTGAILVKLWCRQASPWSSWSQVYPAAGGSTECETGSFTAVASCLIVDNDIDANTCRWGVAIADDDASDVTTAREKITITLMGATE